MLIASMSLWQLPQPAGIARARTPLCVRDDAQALREHLPGIDSSKLLLGTVEPSDMPACVECLMDGFYRDILTIAKDEFSEEELVLLRPTLTVFNGYFERLTRFFLTYEANKRLATRLRSGGLQRGARDDALCLVLQERATGAIVGVVELSQQPRDGKVPGDFRLPSLPWASEASVPDVAYLSNLAVATPWRGRGFGKALVAACEQVARAWQFEEIYLHAATDKERLLSMYKGLAYESLPEYDQPEWVLAVAGREATRFHRKTLAS